MISQPQDFAVFFFFLMPIFFVRKQHCPILLIPWQTMGQYTLILAGYSSLLPICSFCWLYQQEFVRVLLLIQKSNFMKDLVL